jgi:hypothetical protein
MRRTRMAVAAAVVGAAVALPMMMPPLAAQEPPPQTGFEQSNGASWTTHAQELSFLATVDERSDRVEMSTVGTTRQGRPIHLVRVGHPAPRDLAAAQTQPTTLFVCTQHGNEPAGREACLQAIRDLAFTTDPVLVSLLSSQTFLFIPTANPDGRAANTRGNSQGVDVNRDHMGLATNEAKAIAEVVRDWTPDLSVDLHEYGPSEPVLYDDEVLYLWPRNLNVERRVHELARSFSLDHIEPCSENAGYTADVYGMRKVGDVEVGQTAGDHDEGIMRNAMGLRHSLGILIETAVSADATNNLGEEVASSAANQRRRVGSHRHVITCSLEWMRANGATVMAATTTAPLRKQGEGAAQNVPIYFGGADNQAPTAAQTVYPPVCAYALTPTQATQASTTLDLHGIQRFPEKDGTVRVPMGQPAEPVIPLLLDARGQRRILSAARVEAPPLDRRCSPPPPDEEEDANGMAAGGIPIALAGLALAGARLRRRRDALPTG